MRTKSLVAPTGIAEGHEWLSPDGHQPKWHKVFQDGKWVSTAYEDPNFPNGQEEEIEENTEEEEPSTEETTGERSNTAEVPDRDGQQEPDKGAKRPADGKQGKGGQGKRRK